MIYETSRQWRNAGNRRLLLFGMSGVGKTHISAILRSTGKWFHYSVDYRIGTRYMGEHIVDNFKREAMRNPFLADLLKSDSIYIASNITFGNLEPLSTYIGKLGDRKKGGLRLPEFCRRQDLHRSGEIASLLDTGYFIQRAEALYGYRHFVCDSGGSICEIVDPEAEDDPVLRKLSSTLLLVWIKGAPGHSEQLIERFNTNPKPMYYRPEFLHRCWQEYLHGNGLTGDKVDPDRFAQWLYERALESRQPRYEAMARNWGVSVDAEEIASAQTAGDIIEIIAEAIDRR
ncbi:MAG: ATPase [Rhodobacteraceae bacterium]|nr:ATPase [Paracoccaceae bacterium]